MRWWATTLRCLPAARWPCQVAVHASRAPRRPLGGMLSARSLRVHESVKTAAAIHGGRCSRHPTTAAEKQQQQQQQQRRSISEASAKRPEARRRPASRACRSLRRARRRAPVLLSSSCPPVAGEGDAVRRQVVMLPPMAGASTILDACCSDFTRALEIRPLRGPACPPTHRFAARTAPSSVAQIYIGKTWHGSVTSGRQPLPDLDQGLPARVWSRWCNPQHHPLRPLLPLVQCVPMRPIADDFYDGWPARCRCQRRAKPGPPQTRPRHGSPARAPVSRPLRNAGVARAALERCLLTNPRCTAQPMGAIGPP